jgi:hypothetical protein
VKLKRFFALLCMLASAAASATQWVVIETESDPDGAVFYIDHDSLKVKMGVVFFLAKLEFKRTQTIKGGPKYDYRIVENAVYCQKKSMTDLSYAFYTKDGALIGGESISGDVVFDHGKVDAGMFSEMGPAHTPWAKKIIYACNWLKNQGKGVKGATK